MYTDLTYVDQNVVVTPGTSTTQFGTDLVYNLNSPFSPYTGGGVNNHNTSALGLTETGNLYFRYKVHQVDVKVTFYHPHTNTFTESTEATGVFAGVIVNNPSSLSTTLAGNDFGRISKYASVWTRTVPAAGPASVSFTQRFDLHTLFELTKQQYKADINNTTAGVGSSPSTLCQLRVSAADANASATALFSDVRVELTYLVQFYQRKPLTI